MGTSDEASEKQSGCGQVTNLRTVEEMWRDYLFLTNEMDKFLEKNDFAFFQQLLQQREDLKKMIGDRQDTAYGKSLSGHNVLEAIHGKDKVILNKLLRMRNFAKKHLEVENAYNAYSASVPFTRINRQG